MRYTKKILRWSTVPLLMIGLAGCYYTVPAYPPYSAYPPPPPNAAYPYGYAPPQQAYPYPDANNVHECREYTKAAIIEGEKQRVEGTACRQPDGTWKDTVSGTPVQEPPIPNNATVAPNPPLQPYAPLPYGSPPPPPGR